MLIHQARNETYSRYDHNFFATSLSCVSRDEDNVDQKAEIAIRQSNKTIAEISDVNEIDDEFRAGLDYEVVLDENSMAEGKRRIPVREAHRVYASPFSSRTDHFMP